MVERISGWLTPGGSLRRLAQRQTVGGLSRGRFIAVWRPLLQIVISLLLVLRPVAVWAALNSESLSLNDQHEPRTTSQTSDPSDLQSAIRNPQSAIELVPGVPIERELAGGEVHAYRVTLISGQYLHVVVDQRGIDVVVTLFGPDGQQLVEMDSPNGTKGPEPVKLMAETSGDYRVEVRSLEEEVPPGRYEVRIEELREATPQDRSRVAAEWAYAEAERLFNQETATSFRTAIKKYEETLPLWRTLGDHRMEAKTLRSLSVVYGRLDEPQKGLEYEGQALLLFRTLGDQFEEALSLWNMGLDYYYMGEYQKALDYFSQALPLFRIGNHRWRVAVTLKRIAQIYQELGEYQQALDYLNQALANLRVMLEGPLEESGRLPTIGMQAETLINIGWLYGELGDEQKQLEYYGQALPLYQSAARYFGEAITFCNIGIIYGTMGEHQTALEYLGRALAAARARGDRGMEALVLGNMGDAYSKLGEYQKALEHYQQALALYQAIGDRSNEAEMLNNIGETYQSSGENQKALEYYSQALQLSQAIGRRNLQANALYGIARAERDRSNFTEARTQIEAALGIIESLRTKVASPELRASHLASKQSQYEFYIDLLMRLHQRQPADGHDAVALQASERARARSLLETLTESRADVRQGIDPALLERERSLQQQLNAKEQYRMKVLSDQHTEEQAAAAEKEVRDLLTQYQEVQAQIRTTSPRYAALTQPQPLSLKEIQQQVLDEDTLLLEYALGDERSFLWAVTPTSITSFELPKRAEIETAAQRVYELLVNKNEALVPDAFTKLSEMLLGPVADQLGTKRLLIVSDGALQYIPFGALPAPKESLVTGHLSLADKQQPKTNDQELRTNDQRPLIVDHEIVSLPSASVLAVLRRELAGRPPAAKVVAVLADPVFEEGDLRVKRNQVYAQKKALPATAPPSPQVGIENELTRSARQVGLNGFPRLAYTRREAEQLVALTTKDQSLKAVDFAASKAMAMSPTLRQYRIVHLATHGLLNSEQPELTGLVLSLVDEQGKPQDGFLRLHDVYNLSLEADVVVLSACQTALGKEIKGEGLVGLTRGFMYAGAPRVVASLWEVEDVATARLMKRFYQGMVNQGMRPAAALRAAQISLWKEKRWRSPYYWAGFTFQGEWQ